MSRNAAGGAQLVHWRASHQVHVQTVPTLASVVCSCGGLLEEGPDDVVLPCVPQQIKAGLAVNLRDPAAYLQAPNVVCFHASRKISIVLLSCGKLTVVQKSLTSQTLPCSRASATP